LALRPKMSLKKMLQGFWDFWVHDPGLIPVLVYYTNTGHSTMVP
jgi:hypothetical protein